MNRTILSSLLSAAERTPDKRAYLHLERGENEGLQCTYAQLRDRAFAIARVLIEAGARGERAIILETRPVPFMQTFFGCLAAGVVAVPIAVPSPRNFDSMLGIARSADARFILAGEKELRLREALNQQIGQARWLDVYAKAVDSKPPSGFEDVAFCDPDRLAFLQYTSGSTGDPKGVAITHLNLIANETMIGRAMDMHAQSVVVGWLPHYHDMGLIGNLLQTVYQGCECILMQPADFVQKPVRWLRAISKYRGTVSGGPNFAYEMCVARIASELCEGLDLGSWEVAFSGAEPVKSATVAKFVGAYTRHGLDPRAIFPCYGMAEATLFLSGVRPHAGARTFHFRRATISLGRRVAQDNPGEPTGVAFVGCGSATPGVELQIVDPQERRALAQGEVGEVWAHGDSIASGYFGNEAATLETFGAELVTAPGKRFLRTGDLGVMHEGELSIVGRLKDTMIVRGRNVHPQDVEDTLRSAHEVFAQGNSCVFQIDNRGDDDAIVVVQELSREAFKHPDLGAVLANARAKVVSRHELTLANIVVVRSGQIPRTTSGKIKRGTCRDLYKQGGFATDAAAEMSES